MLVSFGDMYKDILQIIEKSILRNIERWYNEQNIIDTLPIGSIIKYDRYYPNLNFIRSRQEFEEVLKDVLSNCKKN